MSHSGSVGESVYWDLCRRGVEALLAARLEEAEALFRKAHEEAERRGMESLVGRAYCNWAAVRVERGETTGIEAGLSAILGGSPDLKARQLAAYHLGILHRNEGRTRIGRFYAEMALRLATALGERNSRAVSSHFVGLLLLAESRLQSAQPYLEEALDLGFREDVPAQMLVAASTLGYCLSLGDAAGEAARLLERTDRDLERLPCPLYEPAVHLNLGFGWLELGDFDSALHHGQLALDQGSPGRRDAKHTHYLLGEALARKGRHGEAREHFEILRRRFYPDLPDLTDMLLACRTHFFVNWLA
jgi:tetratricopeptide (TPR) repeat protein